MSQPRRSTRPTPPSLPPRPNLSPPVARPLPPLPVLNTAIPISSATPSSPRAVTFVDSPTSLHKTNSGRRPPSRIIRTFEEVPKTVLAEEWYEELECGICSHVLGAPQALVPCGHTFCGSCAWQWIRTGKNHTCPHCRMEVLDATPLVPNIIVDQIIERKLRSLPEGSQRTELMVERAEKLESWKVIQASLPKPVQKRSRNLEGVFGFGMFEGPTPESRAEGHRRRASRHYMELGAPIIPQQRHSLANSGMNLGDLRRMEVEEEAVAARMEIRRAREAFVRDQTAGLRHLEEEEEVDDNIGGREMRARTLSNGEASRQLSGGASAGQRWSRALGEAPARRSNESSRRSTPQATAPRVESNPAPTQIRPQPGRLGILAARQARGRVNTGGSRDAPLVVLSDSE